MSDLPRGWARVPMENIADISSGVGFPKDRQGLRAGQFPFAKVSDITKAVIEANGFLSEAANYINEEDLSSLRAKPIPAGSIVFAKIGEALHLNRRARTTVPVVLDNNCMALIPRAGTVDPEFLYRFMTTVSLSPFAVATAVPSVRRTDVARIEVPLPTLTEQRRIVTKLDSLFKHSKSAREELARIPRLVERYKQAILSSAFRGELTADWRCNRSIKTATVVPLEEALLQIKTGPFGSTLHKSDYVSGGVPVVNPMHINDAKITPSGNISITRTKANQLSEFQLKEGDVIIARRGEMGRCAVVSKHESGWLCGTGSMILRPASSLLPHYLQMFLSSPSTITALEADAVGSTMVNLNQKILLSLAIPVPPVDEQAEVILRVQKAFEHIARLGAEATRAHDLLDRLDQATLAKAFRGELVSFDSQREIEDSQMTIRSTSSRDQQRVAK